MVDEASLIGDILSNEAVTSRAGFLEDAAMVLDADGKSIALGLSDEGQAVLIGVLNEGTKNTVAVVCLAERSHLDGARDLVVVYGVSVANRLIHSARRQFLCEGIELIVAHDGGVGLVVSLGGFVSEADELLCGGVHGYILSLLLKVYHNCLGSS